MFGNVFVMMGKNILFLIHSRTEKKSVLRLDCADTQPQKSFIQIYYKIFMKVANDCTVICEDT